MTVALPASLLLVGAGKMGGAMLDGWLKIGLPLERITVIDPHPSPDMQALTAKGLALNPALEGLAPQAVLVLAVKPQMLDEAAPALDKLIGEGTVVLSILAGKTIANIQERLPAALAVVRAMPNLPAAIGRGVTAAVGSAGLTPVQRDLAQALLSGVGSVEWLDDEALIDAVTAISGSGPAYVFHLAECLAEAGRQLGLPADVAVRLARATVSGAGELLHQSDLPAGALRENVTSKGGTTAAALEVLMAADGLQPLITRTAGAAKRRAAELSG
ncbi:Pyrroline-5-carboxylate reductase [Hyphomicrobiales bacterium]|nr:Pyrroline-5-carboxylate reductase [Hyphomicrobiales bacterium]CAH1670101.1 Pyrroline-5-carboxylate reductase [Hyphomicrobiales bacterium]